MRTIRLLFLAVFVPLLFACQKEPLAEPPQPESPAGTHKIPVEKALGDLDALLAAIDGPETRSGGARRVASVEALRAADLARNTRAGADAAAHVGDLVYIANFENGEGYAILGADDRIESVIAITEHGSLTPAQLTAAANGAYDGVDAPPVLPEIGDYLIERMGGIHKYDSLIGVTPPPPPTFVHTYGEWEVCEQRGPYCKMKWGQNDPYNAMTPVKDGIHCPVGCVAVALGQIVATNYFNKYYPSNLNPQPMYIGNMFVSWQGIFSEINNYILYPTTERTYNSSDKEALIVAYFLAGIGEAIGMRYTSSGSYADYDDGIRFLKAMGCTDVDNFYISEGRLNEMIVDRGLPVYACGKESVLWGHTWVIDGMKKWRQLHTCHNTLIDQYEYTYNYKTMYHCNYGWTGQCDGYYYSGTVCCPQAKPLEREDGEGDRNGSDHDYTAGHKWMLYYNW